MPPADTLAAFVLAAAIFAYMPGPAMLYAAAQTVARGRRAGLLAALGIHVGGYLHVVAAATGVSALFHAAPTLYVAVKLMGAAYLIWLGVALLLRRPAGEADVRSTPDGRSRRAFLQSVTVEALNPKTAVFFLAFLPQFADPSAAAPLWAQLLILGIVVNVMFSSADLVCVAMADLAVDRLKRSSAAQRIANIAGGGVLVGLGVKLAIQRD